jgi:hypothetical protein
LAACLLAGLAACSAPPAASGLPPVPAMPAAEAPAPPDTPPSGEPEPAGAAETEPEERAATGDRLRPETADRSYSERVRSVRLHPPDRPLDPPVMALGATAALELRFDDLGTDVRPYRMTVYHCDRDWKRSDLDPYVYLDGFDRLALTDYAFSTLGRTRFVQYTVPFPTPEFRITRSGHYLLLVWDDERPDRPVLTRRFYVTENLVAVTGEVVRPAAPDKRDTHQQLRFRLDTRQLADANPLERVGVTALQNLRPDNALRGLQPQFVREGQMAYERPDQVFPAGKEWRFASLRSLRILGERVARVDREADPPEVVLVPDEVRSFRAYRFRADMNGQWFCAVDDTERDELEADYVRVRFFLRYPAPLSDGGMHLFGGFTDYRLGPETRMTYDLDRGGYTAEWLLKQGVYNWQYAFVPDGGGRADLSVAEGHWYETENRYDVFVHYRDFRERYDRLVGHASFRSVR